MKLILSIDPIRFPLTGIGRYTLELAKQLTINPDVDEILFIQDNRFIAKLPTPSNDIETTTATFHHRLKKWAQQRFLVRATYNKMLPLLKKKTLEEYSDYLFHGPNFFLPPFAGKKVITFHDLSAFTWAACHPIERVRHAHSEMPKSLNQADAVIVVSEFVRQEVAQYFSYPLDKLFTVPLAACSSFRPRTASETFPVLSKYKLTHNQYTLFVGTVEPRKNLMMLIEAYEKLPLRDRFYYPLIISGYEGWLSEAIHARMATAQREGWLRYLGFTAQADLPMLFSGARLFVYPSLYEGFGLPVLEAMQSGVPVVCSNSASLPEVAGGATLMAAPDDEDAWTLLLQQGLQDGQWRLQATAAGIERALAFSWASCARNTIAVYQQCI